MSAAPTFTTPKRPLTWLITGCSSHSGFGLCLARLAMAGGHRVIATSRNPSRTPDLVAEVESKGGNWMKLDVDDSTSGEIIEELEASGQHVDVLVNNAGGAIHAPVETATEDETRRQMETHYFGPLRLIKAAVPHMRQRKFGIIVNFSSGAALEGFESMGIYAAAKAATDGLFRVMSKEVAPFNIRLLTTALGTFNTSFGTNITVGEVPMPDAYKGSVAEWLIDTISSGKFVPKGDKDKAMKALYEVITGEGVGTGHEAEKFLPLGNDLAARLKLVQDNYAHSMEVFGAVAESVKRDDI